MFGAKSSQDVFDEARFRIIGDITHCLNQRDDILLEGRDETKHIEVPKTVLVTVSKRAQNHIQPRKMPVSQPFKLKSHVIVYQNKSLLI